MAEIDSLSINIEVIENKVAERIKDISTALSNLTSQVKDFDKVSKSLEKSLGSKAKINNGILKKTTDAKLKATNTQNIPNVSTPLSTKDTTTDALKDGEKINDQQRELNKNVGVFSKLTRSVVRIGFYRAIRTMLSSTVKAFKEGIGNIRSVDKELDTSLNKIAASGTTLKNSLASMISPLIKSIEPIITRISDSIANFSNRINEAKAAMNGQSKYTKILTSDTEEYQKALQKTNGALLEFDTFTTQASKDNAYTGVIEADVSMSAEEGKNIFNQLQAIEGVLFSISGVIVTIIGLNLVKKITEISSVLKTAKKNSKEFNQSLEKQKNISATLAVAGIGALVTGITSLIVNWGEMGTAAKVLVPTLAVLAGVITALVVGLKAAKGQWGKALAIGAIVTGTGLTVGSQLATMQFANGGNYETGDFFMANENGNTELIASTNNGGGSVMNLSQWQQISEMSFYNALTRYNAKQNGNDGGGITLNDLGTSIARNSSFRNEINRRNPGFNLK